MSARDDAAAGAAAGWWADQVGGSVLHDNGDRSMTGAMATTFAGMLADQHPVTEEAVSSFRRFLANELSVMLATRSYGVSVGTDYHPDMTLAECAEAAGIDGSRFPWKTHMWVHPDHVTVNAGYGASSRLLWTASSYEPRLCGACHYEDLPDGGYRKLPEVCSLWTYHDGPHHFSEQES
jgi:hypothetical protein